MTSTQDQGLRSLAGAWQLRSGTRRPMSQLRLTWLLMSQLRQASIRSRP
ncbi:hypothetical protein OIE68_20315 [Nocardia vinacea]|uniref:Uncharacterized protein n=1 Tax=Nocardia vinacea TaxID=96468 RepID=A0ABZ1YXC8_9NOCA|nr:hypothetical protein [Nocardia vinacea]WSF98211.1 hypothetical protein OIE68_20315 [Nocardia vinacea]